MSAVKKAVKGIGKFVKKHWKKIVVAAAVVFTAGAAAGGLGAVKGAFASKGLLGGIGSTMKAGIGAIGKVATGQGLGAAKASAQAALGGGSASVASAAGAAGKVAATTSKAATTAATTGKAATTAATTGKAATTAATTTGKVAAAAPAKVVAPAAKAATAAAPVASGAGAIAPAAAGTAGVAAPTAAGGFMNSLGGQMLIGAGINAATALLGGQQQDEQQPLAYWGRNARDNSGGVGPSEIAFDAQPNNSSWSAPPSARRLMIDVNGGGP